MPVALSPLRILPGLPRTLRNYAAEMFRPAHARVSVDGMVLPQTQFAGVHIASMAINLGNVLKFFPNADAEGQLNALIGTLSPLAIVMNLPRMYRGQNLQGRKVIDRPCREMTVEALGDELLAPVIDGEYYPSVSRISFKLGPRVHIPKVVGKHRA